MDAKESGVLTSTSGIVSESVLFDSSLDGGGESSESVDLSASKRIDSLIRHKLKCSHISEELGGLVFFSVKSLIKLRTFFC